MFLQLLLRAERLFTARKLTVTRLHAHVHALVYLQIVSHCKCLATTIERAGKVLVSCLEVGEHLATIGASEITVLSGTLKVALLVGEIDVLLQYFVVFKLTLTFAAFPLVLWHIGMIIPNVRG